MQKPVTARDTTITGTVLSQVAKIHTVPVTVRPVSNLPRFYPHPWYTLLELRERKWVARNAVAAPTTIAQIQENVIICVKVSSVTSSRMIRKATLSPS